MSQKRGRSFNWEDEEKQLLLSVLKGYAKIIENKATNTNTNRLKIKAWEEIHRKFNELNRRPRELNDLRLQWKRMKMKARKSLKTEANETDGGRRLSTIDETIDVKDILNQAEQLSDDPIDSNGTTLAELELSSSNEAFHNKLQDSKLVKNQCKEEIGNYMFIEALEDIDSQVTDQTSDDDMTMDTSLKPNLGSILGEKVPKRGMPNNIRESVLDSTEDTDDNIGRMLKHSQMLEKEKHVRRMEMAEEEHAIKMQIHKQQLKSAVLETEILKLRKMRECL